MSNGPKITVYSWVDGSNIHIKTLSEFNGVTSQLYRRVMQTQEAAILEGLIALGWTPPLGRTKYGETGMDDSVSTAIAAGIATGRDFADWRREAQEELVRAIIGAIQRTPETGSRRLIK